MNLLPAEYGALFVTFFLVYVRVAAMIVVMPVLSNETVMMPVKAGLAFWVAVIIMAPYMGLNEAEFEAAFPIVKDKIPGLMGLTLAVVSEMIIGFTMGFVGQVLLVAISISGEVIGQQAGFSAASVLDPVTGQDAFLMATIKLWFATIIFVVIGGIETGLQILAKSFEVVIPGAGFTIDGLGNMGYEVFNYQSLGSLMYELGVHIAAPMIAAMVLISVAEAFIARTVPQLNILVVGFAVRIGIGLFLLHNMMIFTTEKFRLHMDNYAFYALSALTYLQ